MAYLQKIVSPTGGGDGVLFPQYNFTGTDLWNLSSYATTLTASNAGTDTLILFPFHLSKDITLSEVAMIVVGTEPSRNARIGIYTISQTTGDLTLLADWGLFSTTSAGVVPATVTTALSSGTPYILAFVEDSVASWQYMGVLGTASVPFFHDGTDFGVGWTKSGVTSASALAASYTLADLTTRVDSLGFPVILYR